MIQSTPHQLSKKAEGGRYCAVTKWTCFAGAHALSFIAELLHLHSIFCPSTSLITCWNLSGTMKPKRDEIQSNKTASQLCSSAASNKAILLAIANQAVEVGKASKLVDELKK